MTPDQFWRMTPVELVVFIEARTRLRRYEDERAMTAAWLMARLSRAKKIPSLFRLISYKDQATHLSPERAAEEKARHEALIQQVAPDAITDTEAIEEYNRRQEAQNR